MHEDTLLHGTRVSQVELEGGKSGWTPFSKYIHTLYIHIFSHK